MSKKVIENKIEKIANKLHLFVFGVDMGSKSKNFAKNISLSFSGGMIAFGILFLASIVTARVLGPAEYGKYAVIFSIAQMLSLFFVLELDVSTLYFLSEKSSNKKNITASIIVMFFINIFVFTFLAVGVYKFLSPDNISQFAFAGSVIMALTFAVKRMLDAFLRVGGRFKQQAIFKIAESLTVISVVSIFFWPIGQRDYSVYIISIILGGIVFIVLSFSVLRKIFAVRSASVDSMDKIFKYNIFGIIGAIVNSIIKNIDKIIVVMFLGAAVGGVYAVYFTASVIVGARITQLFINVFFPTIRAHGDVKTIFAKVNKLFIKTFIPITLIAMAGVFVIVVLYGSQYPLVWSWVVLSGLYIAVHFFAAMYGWMLSSISKDGYKKYNMSFIYSFFVYILVMSLVFVNDAFGITALLSSLVLYRITGGLVSFVQLRKQVK